MAIMIPHECDLSQRPMSEQIVFEELKKRLPDSWYVFHSFDYITRDLNRKIWDGEIDFLLYHPKQGILILEVKGGAISYRYGHWYQEDRIIDPVEQAKRNKYAVMHLLQGNHKQNIPLKFAHAVCFPGCGSQEVWPPEAYGLVLTADGLPFVESFVERLLADVQIPSGFSGMIPEEDILRILTPYFEYGKTLSEQIRVEERQFFRFTEQQCELLSALECFPRLQIKGCAGSGKTIMALKKAQRLAAQGKQVLLLCYNQLLAKYLKRSVRDDLKITAAAFFDFCLEQLQVPADQVEKYSSDPRLYSIVLPKMLRDYLEHTFLSYDAVIVDEGQDFTKAAWDVISLLPNENGCFYIFYDPDQNIFSKDLYLPDFGLPPVVLTKNCRNTKKIFEQLKPYRSEKSEIMESSPSGSDVRVLSGNCRENLEKELDRLVMQEQVPLQNIVILGGHSMEHTSIGSDPVIGRYTIVNRPIVLGAKEISYYTYMKFKGCESKVIILLDVDESDPRWNSNGLYTAMSRAVHHLVILKKQGGENESV